MARPCFNFPVPYSVVAGKTPIGYDPSTIVGAGTGSPVGFTAKQLSDFFYRVRLWELEIVFPSSSPIPVTIKMPFSTSLKWHVISGPVADDLAVVKKEASMAEAGNGHFSQLYVSNAIPSISFTATENFTAPELTPAIPDCAPPSSWQELIGYEIIDFDEFGDPIYDYDQPIYISWYDEEKTWVSGVNVAIHPDSVGWFNMVPLLRDGLYYPIISFYSDIDISHTIGTSPYLEGTSLYRYARQTAYLNGSDRVFDWSYLSIIQSDFLDITLPLGGGTLSIPLYRVYTAAGVAGGDFLDEPWAGATFTLKPKKYWPYKDEAGVALYNETTGALV